MATQLQLRRGTTVENDAFVGAAGEMTMDTDTNGLRVHDGTTPGGFMVDTVVAFQLPDANNGYKWYRKYASGWVEQGGKTTQTATSSVDATITLPVEMQDTEYTVTFSVCSSVANDGAESSVLAQTSVGMNLHADSMSSTSGTKGFMWEVKGMAA